MDALDQGPAGQASPQAQHHATLRMHQRLGTASPLATALAAAGFLPRQELPACAL